MPLIIFNRILFLSIVIFLITSSLFAQKKQKDTSPYYHFSKGKKGFELRSSDNNYLLQIDFRGQFRASYPFDKYPTTLTDFNKDNTSFNINRARIKIGGNIYKPYYKFYFEQDIKGNNLLDYRIMLEKYPFLKLKVGQWKVRYSRERIISSGNQTDVDRSLINSIFTVDRQQGVSIYGNLNNDGLANFNYWASVLTGTGRGANSNDDSNLMYLLRLQWNPNKEVLKFSGSDLEKHQKFISSIAFAGVTNISKYTRFSTSGGGQLHGFEEGIDGQFKIDQLMFETAFKYKGFSWQQELHYKNIDDRVNNVETNLIGNYFQLGYFFHNSFPKFPEHLEIFARQAFYNPNKDIDDNNNFEYTLGCNWFFKGHKNKLTFDYSYLKYNEFNPYFKSGNRFRLQWDISIF